MRFEDMPRFRMGGDIPGLVEALEASMGGCEVSDEAVRMMLTRESLVRSIRSSIAIEGNELDIRQVSDIMDGIETDAPFDQMMEARGAANAYRMIDSLEPWSVDDFLKAEDEMTFGLVEEPGFRTVDVGIFEGDKLIYKAPEASSVAPMVEKLFEWCSRSELPIPIVASIAHFYIETIHPFVDGNGRMGRLWNMKILTDSNPLYRLVSMETCILERRDDYYAVLECCQRMDDCSDFVAFCLECLISGFADLRHREYFALR